jgi:hypothetical protein
MVIQNKRRGMLTYGVVLVHDCASIYSCRHSSTTEASQLFDHPPYSLDLAPSNYHLLPYLKKWAGSQLISNNEELFEHIKT